MEQTAIDWFLENLPLRFKNSILNTCQEEIKQAREKNKEQIMEAWENGDFCIDLPDGTWEQKYKSAEEYYDKNYNQIK
jgi:hypothetical protein